MWLEKLFEAKVSPRTLTKRAERLATNVANDSTPEEDTETEENQEIKWGGTRQGAGRPPKFRVVQEPNREFDNIPHKAFELIRIFSGGAHRVQLRARNELL